MKKQKKSKRFAQINIKVDLSEDSKSDDELTDMFSRTVVIELLRQGEISRGKAAELLKVSPWEMFEIMSKEKIPHLDITLDEIKRGVKVLDGIDPLSK